MSFNESQARDKYGRWSDSAGNEAIGKTGTGKTVYTLPATSKMYSGFTPQEHADAARLHNKMADTLKSTGVNYHEQHAVAAQHR